MNRLSLIALALLVAMASVALHWTCTRHAESAVIEVTWIRSVVLQKRDHGDRWVWAGVRENRGSGTVEPSWPSLSDVGPALREVSRMEVYTAVLVPVEFPSARWRFSTSRESLYEELVGALRNNGTVLALGAAFGTVHRLA